MPEAHSLHWKLLASQRDKERQVGEDDDDDDHHGLSDLEQVRLQRAIIRRTGSLDGWLAGWLARPSGEQKAAAAPAGQLTITSIGRLYNKEAHRAPPAWQPGDERQENESHANRLEPNGAQKATSSCQSSSSIYSREAFLCAKTVRTSGTQGVASSELPPPS